MSEPVSRRRWPAIRGVLVALHVLAIVVLAFPGAGQLANRQRWESANTRAELERWSARLDDFGVSTTPAELKARMQASAARYLAVHRVVVWPFVRYARATGAHQGWSMFASPQKVPAELHVDVREGSTWRPLVRPWDRTLDWRATQRRHHRVRKALGRLARAFHRDRYEGLARWMATMAARDFPEVQEIRVSLWRERSLPVHRVRAGEQPSGHYEHVLSFDAETLR